MRGGPCAVHAGVGEPLVEAWPRAGAPIVTDDLAAQAFALDLEVEDVVEGGDIAFHAADIGDLDHPAHAVALALDLHDQVHGADDLGQDGAGRQAHVAHLHHVLDAGQRVARGVGVDGGHAAVMAGVHRLQHVERLAAAHLADDDAIGPHAQRVAHQVALGHLAASFQAGEPGLQPHHVRLLQLQFGGVLDRDDALADVDQPRQRVQQRRLAGAGAAGDDHVEACARRPSPAAGRPAGSSSRIRSAWRSRSCGARTCGSRCRDRRAPAAETRC